MPKAIEKDSKSEKKIEEWEIEDAVRTLTRAEEIKLNTDLMKLVLPKLEKTKKAIDNISQAEILYGKKEKGNKDESKG